jgi:hypothetical protein
MFKSFPIFRKNGAHLILKRMNLKNGKDCPFLRFECFEHAKHFLFVSSFEHINFAINEKYSKNFWVHPQYNEPNPTPLFF